MIDISYEKKYQLANENLVRMIRDGIMASDCH